MHQYIGPQSPFLLRGRPGRDGIQGIPGKPGKDGTAGSPGSNGRDGRDGAQGARGNYLVGRPNRVIGFTTACFWYATNLQIAS